MTLCVLSDLTLAITINIDFHLPYILQLLIQVLISVNLPMLPLVYFVHLLFPFVF